MLHLFVLQSQVTPEFHCKTSLRGFKATENMKTQVTSDAILQHTAMSVWASAFFKSMNSLIALTKTRIKFQLKELRIGD